jgi:predicted ATPase
LCRFPIHRSHKLLINRGLLFRINTGSTATKRFILTGTPGAGKTSVISLMEANGHSVVRETATDVIARLHQTGIDEPWRNPDFIGLIFDEQIRRIKQATGAESRMQFHDRSPFCTCALSVHLGFGMSASQQQSLNWLIGSGMFERHVFFMENLGFVEQTEARRIRFDDALIFEAIHRDVYLQFGFTLVPIQARPVPERVAMVLKASEGFSRSQ